MNRMRTNQRFLTGAFAAAVLLCAWPSQALAQTKIAVISFQEALIRTADMQKQSADLEAKYTEPQEELNRLSAELQEIQQKLESASETEAPRLQIEFQRKQRTAQRLSQDLQSDVEFDRENILNSASVRMRDVINQLRVDEEIDLIIDSSSVLAHSALIDLTAQATAAYDAKHPAP